MSYLYISNNLSHTTSNKSVTSDHIQLESVDDGERNEQLMSNDDGQAWLDDDTHCQVTAVSKGEKQNTYSLNFTINSNIQLLVFYPL